MHPKERNHKTKKIIEYLIVNIDINNLNFNIDNVYFDKTINLKDKLELHIGLYIALLYSYYVNYKLDQRYSISSFANFNFINNLIFCFIFSYFKINI